MDPLAGLETSIQENIQLVKLFLANVTPLLSATGEVHMTLLNRFPYTAWKVRVQPHANDSR
jgi:hypothetical protein